MNALFRVMVIVGIAKAGVARFLRRLVAPGLGIPLPPKAVEQHDEAVFFRQIFDLGQRHERILQAGGDDGEILAVLRHNLEIGAVHALPHIPYSAALSERRSISAPQLDSLVVSFS